MPEPLWPSDNEWGVPALLLHRQAGVLDLPLTRWGRARRKSRMRGTWHFYTDDHRFGGLWSRPEGIINSGCVAAVEANYSVPAQLPRAAALWATYRKRWLARLWQEHGVRTLVDLNVAPEHAEINLLGVPPGWSSYATRGSVHELGVLELQHELALERAGGPVLLVVVGGGRAVAELARARGWVWVPEERDVVREVPWVAELTR